MTHTSASSDSPESISSYENKTRPSTSHSQGSSHSRSRSATVNAPRSVNSTTRSAPAAAQPHTTDSRSSPRHRISRTPLPTTTSTSTATPARALVRSETPSDMSTSQTLTSTNTATAAEGSWRIASFDSGGYHRYACTTPHFPARLIVNATATLTNNGISTAAAAAAAASAGSGGGGGDANVVGVTSPGSHGSAQDRHGYSYSHSQSQSYSQIGTLTTYADGSSQQTPQRQMEDRVGMSSHLHSQSSWRTTTITEIPAADTDASSATSSTSSNNTAALVAASSGSGSNLRSSPFSYGNIPASASSSTTSAGWAPNKPVPAEYDHVRVFPELPGHSSPSSSDVYRPPSLSSFELTPAAARATAYAELSFPPHSASWNSKALRSLNTDRHSQWDPSPPPSTSATNTSYSVSQLSGTVPAEESSSAHTYSPERSGPSSWVRGAPHTMAGSDGSVYSRYARSHAIKVPQRPSLARSTLFTLSESSSSLQLTSFDASASGACSTPEPASTSASAAQASPCVPEPPNPLPLSQYGTQSPVSPPSLRENPPASLTTALSPLSITGRQEYFPSYDSESHSPASTRLVQSDASPEREQVWHRQPTAVLRSPPRRQDDPFVLSTIGPAAETGASPESSSSVSAVDASGTRRVSYASAGPSFARESGSSSQSTVPVTITAARPYDYSYFNSFPASAPISTPGIATSSTTVTGNSSTSQSTRKRNHHCLMCDKSFDRPSTLRKHLLVHTGEKAHVCEICGRRFGVASNLNRHFRRCIARPVNSAAFRSTPSTSVSAAPQTPSQSNSMAREQTNPDVRRAERQRDGREVPEDEQTQARSVRPAPSATDPSMQAPRGRRRGRSPGQTPLGVNIPATSEAGTSSSQEASYQLRSALNPAGSSGQASGQLAVATAGTGTSTGEGETERRPKRRRRAPSPSRWVPASLRNFSLSPVRTRTSTPLPPISPGYDAATGSYEERDSYATVADENIDPSGENNDTVRTRAERLRNFEYAPYHPCGWTGRLPGPAVVGNDVTNYTKGVGGGSGHGGRYSGGNSGGGLHFMFEFSLAAAG